MRLRLKTYQNKIQAAADNALDSSKSSSAVVFNGEEASYPLSGLVDKKLGSLYLRAVVTSDRKAVKLRCTNRQLPAATINAIPPTAINSIVTTKPATANKEADQETAAVISEVVEIARQGFVTIDVTSMLENNDSNRKAILFVRPTISCGGKKQLN